MKTRLLTIGMSLLCGIGVPGAQTPQPAPAPQPLAAQEELRAQGEHPAREALPAQGEPPQWGGAQHGGDEIRPLDDSLALMELLYGEPLTLPGDWLGQSGNPAEGARAEAAAADARTGPSFGALHTAPVERPGQPQRVPVADDGRVSPDEQLESLRGPLARRPHHPHAAAARHASRQAAAG